MCTYTDHIGVPVGLSCEMWHSDTSPRLRCGLEDKRSSVVVQEMMCLLQIQRRIDMVGGPALIMSVDGGILADAMLEKEHVPTFEN